MVKKSLLLFFLGAPGKWRLPVVGISHTAYAETFANHAGENQKKKFSIRRAC